MDYAPDGNLMQWAQAQGGIANVPLATRLTIVAQVADRGFKISLRHQFGCSVSSDRRTSIWPFCIRVS